MGRKGLRVTGPMITRARISKRDPFLSSSRGERFLGPVPAPGDYELAVESVAALCRTSRGNNGAHQLKELCDREGWESSPATGEEFSSCAQHRPEPPFAGYPCNMDSRSRGYGERFVALTIVSKTRRRHNALSFFERSSTNPLHL